MSKSGIDHCRQINRSPRKFPFPSYVKPDGRPGISCGGSGDFPREGWRKEKRIFQNTHPQGLMGREQNLPSVEGGNGNPCTFIDLLYTCPAKEVIPQHQKDEP